MFYCIGVINTILCEVTPCLLHIPPSATSTYCIQLSHDYNHVYVYFANSNSIIGQLPTNISSALIPHLPSPPQKPTYGPAGGLKCLDSDDEAQFLSHTLNSARNYQKFSLSTISGCQATIIVCPERLIENWEEEINKHTHPNNLQVLQYHGRNRCKDFIIKSIQSNIIITTYETLQTDFRSTPKGPVYDYQWYRVILDEAHVIRNSHAHVHAAIMSLQTKNQLFLTGTPLNNFLSDYMSLFEFISCNQPLGAQPWDGILQKHLEIGDLKPFHIATCHLMLHQSKKVVVPSLPLICEEEVFRPLPSTIRLYYDKMFIEKFSEYLYTDEAEEGKKKSQRRNLLVSIQQLRRLCNHPILAETTSSREEVHHVNDVLLGDIISQGDNEL
ncbi:hypothetical protein O181_012046 [Austropuccinia psidii MF-1]|uniref:Helicase ATP-binding domain-containing protein n=1 Tax=Austropuccinia psidii MF-1 TaxID=1389203 RepID=A0A9Q3GLX6_9BASI|nr:hypothetical protein [Austropuccinia psidii MF-1]